MSWIAFVFLALTVPVTYAEVALEEINVTAEKEVKKFNFSSSRDLTTSDLEKSPSTFLFPHLEGQPGIITNQDGGPGGRVSFFFRGTESRHVSFTIDGLKINDPSNVDRQFDGAFFTSSFLKDVQIFKGPQAVLFGSDAFGGLVDMRTRKGEGAPETRVNFMGGSFGTVQSSLAKDWSSKKHSGSLTWAQFHTDGISRLNKKRFDATEKDSADISQLSSSSRHKWGSKWDTDLLFSFLRGKNELDGSSSDNSHDHSENDQYITQQKTNYVLNKNSAISLRNGLSRHQRFVDTLSSGNQSYAGNLIQNELLYHYEKDDLSFLSGLASDREDYKSAKLDKQFQLNSTFLQAAYSLNDFKFQAGGRMDHHSLYGQFLTGSAGLSLDVQGHLMAVQYSQGYKAPSLFQLYTPSYGNIDLVPERNHSWEARFQKTGEMIETEVVYFRNNLSNLITWANNKYFNQGRFVAEGMEVSLKAKGKYFELTPSYTHQEFHDEQTAVLRRPMNFSQLVLTIFPSQVTELSIKNRWFDSRKDYDEARNVVSLSGYNVVDLGFRFVQEKYDLTAQILNVFNRDYENIYGYSVTPLSFFTGLGLRF